LHTDRTLLSYQKFEVGSEQDPQVGSCATVCYMATTQAAVGVRELRQNLSVYLERVKRGESLNVTEFRQVVAVLRPPAGGDDALAHIVAKGHATPAMRAPSELPPALKARLKRPLSALLDEGRDDTI